MRSSTENEGADFLAELFPRGILTDSCRLALERRRKIHERAKALALSHVSQENQAQAEWNEWLPKIEKKGKYNSKIFSKSDTQYLLNKLAAEKEIDKKKALVLLAQDLKMPVRYVAKFSGISLRRAYHSI